MDIPEIRLSATCAVFAQSEIVELIAKDVSEDEILRAVIIQILTQARTLTDKIICDRLALSGGLSLIPGISRYAEEVLGRPVTVPEHGMYLAAIGCSLLAGNSV